MFTAKRNIDLFKHFSAIHFKKMRYFGMNTITELITNILFIVMNILFWQTIYNYQLNLSWTYQQMLVFLAYGELFYAFKNGFFQATTKFWVLIVTGKIDAYLIRPVNPVYRIIIANMDFMELVKGSFMFVFLLIISKVNFHFSFLVFSIIICFIATFIYSLIELILGYLSFQFGKIEVVFELIDSLVRFNKYPLNILPKGFFYFFIFGLPLAFISTFPALITIDQLKLSTCLYLFLLSVLLLFFWLGLHQFFWQRGLKSYESYNG
ncbi:ABC-2 family transporter protein [Fervidibacillus albus]|uniref:ABC transporter permease n=1 Tax=Fervidibacillus albus TaxID=2980026 RepID=A0A9E8LVE9_9BACI|nr:ABC-2 family transporter protein [Fervidibacillus albus]WAA09851.1 ABC transporter permease [Fervidibacillus albus]